ncbi:hypothetical protein [Dyadobacter sp. NIV53]|uniref:hypothetical protein n=1 Tax=Dyadobacter sp. NIV53 TaxID=2861765 RepID=UPI001E5FE094|nr:hypothetical protein [Dyadobacter sp. NIV53]
MLTNPHIFSNLILSLTGAFIFYKYYNLQPLTNRLLWGFFLLPISVNALVELFVFAGLDISDNLQNIIRDSERTLGAVCLVSASWCVIMRYEAKNLMLFSTISLGLLLLFCITWYHVQFMGLIIQPFCIIVTLLISCLGLGNKQKSALWVIVSMTLLALSTKSHRIPLPMDPIDINRYMTVLAVICFGNAIRDEYKILF